MASPVRFGSLIAIPAMSHRVDALLKVILRMVIDMAPSVPQIIKEIGHPEYCNR
jgi:hypothetical protein